ncbi:beta-ketoacyl synthase N-terminal-like domain-containing protein [Streptomonospora wellingtoniae]|uniref:Beta-ketoacyl synthase N-terminal-like domain-containing protein n=1 Tax=Streptomonospora wellingtoniae TaxID=3075544 RepID=A0ABU2KW83_9ACTN|nr:beta-ketoacyl synthase N-terminal-like domain-containing protein [Streptomonospora sp. DSM 45055]MDT0303559.1 beta-ketoacyl synthase N-terminal-like domain-containing protein [Streptomonospora sp. DSM 45055]
MADFPRRTTFVYPEPFNVSLREAAAMDPRQRIALELVWEAVEDTRLPAERLRGAVAAVNGAESAVISGAHGRGARPHLARDGRTPPIL